MQEYLFSPYNKGKNKRSNKYNNKILNGKQLRLAILSSTC